MQPPPTKRSTVDKTLNFLVLSLFTTLMCLVLFCAVASGIWAWKYDDDAWYLELDTEVVYYAVKNFGTWFILLSNFVPISLWVTLELVKAGQAKFMGTIQFPILSVIYRHHINLLLLHHQGVVVVIAIS